MKDVDSRCLGKSQHLYQQKANKAKGRSEDKIMGSDQHILNWNYTWKMRKIYLVGILENDIFYSSGEK